MDIFRENREDYRDIQGKLTCKRKEKEIEKIYIFIYMYRKRDRERFHSDNLVIRCINRERERTTTTTTTTTNDESNERILIVNKDRCEKKKKHNRDKFNVTFVCLFLIDWSRETRQTGVKRRYTRYQWTKDREKEKEKKCSRISIGKWDCTNKC